jgi:hypothetical protein
MVQWASSGDHLSGATGSRLLFLNFHTKRVDVRREGFSLNSDDYLPAGYYVNIKSKGGGEEYVYPGERGGRVLNMSREFHIKYESYDSAQRSSAPPRAPAAHAIEIFEIEKDENHTLYT